MSTTSTPSFTEIFKDRLARIEADAKAVGMNFTSLCKEVGVSRATPDRWKRRTPLTVEMVTKMEELVAEKRSALGALVKR